MYINKMRFLFCLYAFLSRGVHKNKKLHMAEEEENFLVEMKKLKNAIRRNNSGCDERHEEEKTNTETLLQIKTNMEKLKLLNGLQDPSLSLLDKELLLKDKSYILPETTMAYNISAGGLWDDFNREIST